MVNPGRTAGAFFTARARLASMRWDSLFDDLEAQLERELSAEEGGLRAEEERLRIARLTLRDRVRALTAADPEEPIRLRLRSGERLRMRVRALGSDWVSGELLADDGRATASAVVPIAGLLSVSLPIDRVRASLAVPSRPEKGLAGRLALPVVLRDLARRRIGVEVVTAREVLVGTLDRITGDALDLAVHTADVRRRATDVHLVEVVPLTEVLAVRVP